jgi:hypothetical protein
LTAEPPGLADWLRSRRLAAEVAALGDLADRGLSRQTRRALAIERERVRAAALTRAPSLRRAGRALAEAGIPAWLYKGEGFVRLTHGDASRRPMADLDLVVSRQAQDRACAALVAAGFTETPHATALHDVLMDEHARGPGHPHGVALELHGDVFPPPHPFELDLEGVLARTRPSELPGLRLPSHEDAVLLHAFHLLLFEQDARKGQLALFDLAALALRCKPSLLQARAEAAGVVPVLQELLDRAREQVWHPGPDPESLRVDELLHRAGDGPRRQLPALRARRPLPRRRRLALLLTLRELDLSLADESLEPPQRVLSRRLVAALWQPRLGDCLSALVRGAVGHGGTAARLKRYAGALSR